MKNRDVYNLQFPSYKDELIIQNYKFRKIEDYDQAIHRLHHNISISHEHSIKPTTGTHAVTASVEPVREESASVLPWAHPGTALLDIELLLSLMTHREVFSLSDDDAKSGAAIIRDPRLHQRGYSLRSSMKYERSSEDDHGRSHDAGFENGLNKLYELINSPNWQSKYWRGYVLFLARQAFITQAQEKAFLQSFTVWEHLYAIHHIGLKSEDDIYKIDGTTKIAFLLKQYGFVKKLSDKNRIAIQFNLTFTRNRIAHFGNFSTSKAGKDAEMFCELTAQLLALVLNLEPKDTMCARPKLTELLARSPEHSNKQQAAPITKISDVLLEV